MVRNLNQSTHLLIMYEHPEKEFIAPHRRKDRSRKALHPQTVP
jgi:hypothetical protein